MDGDARERFAAHGIPDGDVGRYASQLPAKLSKDFTGTMKLLRKEDFQELLVNYPRRKKTFVSVPEYQDNVTSGYLIRDGLGKEYKPADYLDLFARFVRENPARVEAIRILLGRPRKWGTKALAELKTKLTAAPEHFTVELLQKAHQAQYHKALVDIISMVKHAAKEQEPLLTAEERVARAFESLTAGRTFTPAQQKWLDRIREHLVTNLSIDRGDFDGIPILSGAGAGAGRTRRSGANCPT